MKYSNFNEAASIKSPRLFTNSIVAISDISEAVKRYSLAGMLGWQDVLQRYRRSSLGPFWITIGMGVMIGTIGIVFGKIFKSQMSEFLPYLTLGMVIWGLIFSVVTESCNSFISAEGIIKQLPIPLFTHILRTIWRNIIIFGHNILIYPIVLVLLGKSLSWIALLSILGLILIIINLTWVSIILGVVCTRYRDLPQIVTSTLQVIFYLTPVMWMPHLLSQDTGSYLLELNPTFHLLQIFRAPLLGQVPTINNWCISISIAVVGWALAILIYGRYKQRIVYWL
jgi:ABC-type polysaccharide/polyol phosphate export permease